MSPAPAPITLNGQPLPSDNGHSAPVAPPADARSSVPDPSLLDDYLCAELSPRAITQRNNFSLDRLYDWAESIGTEAELSRLEKFSLRRARVIGALMRPQVLQNLFESMQAAQVGTDTHRRAATTLLRMIDSDHLSRDRGRGRSPRRPGEGSGFFPTSSDLSGPHSGAPGARRGKPCSSPAHRMSEFLNDFAAHPPAPQRPEPQASPLMAQGSSPRCPLCGGPWTHPTPPDSPPFPEAPAPSAPSTPHSTCTPSGCDGIPFGASCSGGFAPELAGHGESAVPRHPAQPPAIHSPPSGLPDPSPPAQDLGLTAHVSHPHSAPTPAVTSVFNPDSPDYKPRSTSSPCLCASVVKSPPDSRAPT